MKKHLGFVTAIGLVATSGSMVIACNTKQNDSPAKIALKQLIDQVRPIVRDYPGRHDDPAFSRLSIAFWSAENCYSSPQSTDVNYQESYVKLNEIFKEFQNPGYEKEKEYLTNYMNVVIDYVKKDEKRRSPTVIRNLEQALKKTREVLENEVNPTQIKLARINLEFYFHEYARNDGTEDKYWV